MSVTKNEMTAIGQFSVQFTLFVALWNHAEATARRILQLMLGECDTAMAIAVEMQNRSLSNALRAGAKDPQFVHIRAALEHLLEGYEILLEHRNYHAHSLLGVNENGGVLLSVSAKGRLKLSKAQSTMAELEALKNHVSAWIGFAAAIEQELGAEGDGLQNLIAAYEASLERPPWPARVQKIPVFLQAP
jgi:hypothetical protein